MLLKEFLALKELDILVDFAALNDETADFPNTPGHDLYDFY